MTLLVERLGGRRGGVLATVLWAVCPHLLAVIMLVFPPGSEYVYVCTCTLIPPLMLCLCRCVDVCVLGNILCACMCVGGRMDGGCVHQTPTTVIPAAVGIYNSSVDEASARIALFSVPWYAALVP